MAEETRHKNSSPGRLLIVLALVFIAATFVFSIRLESVGLALGGFALGCVIISLIAREPRSNEKTSGAGLSLWVLLMSIWLLTFVIFRL